MRMRSHDGWSSIIDVVTEDRRHSVVSRIERWARHATDAYPDEQPVPKQTRREQVLELVAVLSLLTAASVAWDLGGPVIGAIALGGVFLLSGLLGRWRRARLRR